MRRQRLLLGIKFYAMASLTAFVGSLGGHLLASFFTSVDYVENKRNNAGQCSYEHKNALVRNHCHHLPVWGATANLGALCINIAYFAEFVNIYISHLTNAFFHCIIKA